MSVKVDKPVKCVICGREYLGFRMNKFPICVLCRKYKIPKMYNDGRYWDDKKKVAILPRRK
jgi:hypothetical protein